MLSIAVLLVVAVACAVLAGGTSTPKVPLPAGQRRRPGPT